MSALAIGPFCDDVIIVENDDKVAAEYMEAIEQSVIDSPDFGDENFKMYKGEQATNWILHKIMERYRQQVHTDQKNFHLVSISPVVNELYLHSTVLNQDYNRIRVGDPLDWPPNFLRVLAEMAPIRSGLPDVFFLPLLLEFRAHFITVLWEGVHPKVVYVSDNLGPISHLTDVQKMKDAEQALALGDLAESTKTALSVHRAVKRIFAHSPQGIPRLEEFVGFRYPHNNGCGWSVASDMAYFSMNEEIMIGDDVPPAIRNRKKDQQLIPIADIYRSDSRHYRPKRNVNHQGKDPRPVAPTTASKSSAPIPLENKSTTATTAGGRYLHPGLNQASVFLATDQTEFTAATNQLSHGLQRPFAELVDSTVTELDPTGKNPRLQMTKHLLNLKLEEIAKIMMSLK